MCTCTGQGTTNTRSAGTWRKYALEMKELREGINEENAEKRKTNY